MNHEISHSIESRDEPRKYNTEETDLDVIADIEQDEVIQNPENVGINLTGDQIISTARMRKIAEAQALVDSVGEEEAYRQISEQYGIPAEQIGPMISSLLEQEMSKTDALKNMLENLPDGISFRVHPYAPESPFSLINCQQETDGVKFISFDPVALEQMKLLYEEANSGEKPGELSVVMNPFTAERANDIPETPAEIEAYADMCCVFLAQLGLEENGGEGICLELGNETNVDHSITGSDGSKPFDREDFPTVSDPKKYAHMFAVVAKRIKSRFPNVKLAIAGTAMFDDQFLESVITGVLDESDGDTSLIDKISFHPYRDTLEEGASTFRDHKFAPSELSYDQQVARMRELAAMTDASFDVGEVSFSHPYGKAVDMAELHKNSADARSRGIKSYTWPGKHMIQFS